jgi:DNA polymerase
MDMEKLRELREECLACRKCSIGGELFNVAQDGKPRLANVFSNMVENAKVMAVGQNPGSDEVQQGVPFVGRAGKVFDAALLEIVGIERKDIYVGNCCRCYTPGNRKPTETELDSCRSFLSREIELVAPKLIIALGGIAFKQLTGMNGIMKHHGEVLVSIKYHVSVICVLHPSPLNTNNPERNEAFRSDLRKVKEFLDGRRPY